jgi:hypothetical protein
MSFADRYKYSSESAVRSALAKAHDAPSALEAIYDASRWKAGKRNDWRLTIGGPAAWRAIRMAREPLSSPHHRFVALTELDGVGAPIASAILTFIDDLKFTMIDWRAWVALGGKRRTQYSWECYKRYLLFCKADSDRLGLDLRTYDKALWVAGKNLFAPECSGACCCACRPDLLQAGYVR